MPDKLIGYMMNQRRAFRETVDERHDRRTAGAGVVAGADREHARPRAPPCCPATCTSASTRSASTSRSCTRAGPAGDHAAGHGRRRAAARRARARSTSTTRRCSARIADRMTPAAVIPMHTPEEAIEELRYVRSELGLKACVFAGDVLRPVPQFAREHPELARVGALPGLLRHRQPVRLRPGVAEVHRARRRADVPLGPDRLGMSRVGLASPVQPDRRLRRGRRGARQVAVLRWCHDAGSPTLRFGFLEGGVTWAQSLYCRMLDHWKKRNGDAIVHLDPQLLDASLFAELIDDVRAPEGAGDPRPPRAGLAVVRLPRRARRLVGVRDHERRRLRAAVRAALLLTGARATTAWSPRRWTSGSTRSARGCSPCSAPTSATST